MNTEKYIQALRDTFGVGVMNKNLERQLLAKVQSGETIEKAALEALGSKFLNPVVAKNLSDVASGKVKSGGPTLINPTMKSGGLEMASDKPSKDSGKLDSKN